MKSRLQQMKITGRKYPIMMMLLTRWDMLSAFAATEKIYNNTKDEPEIRQLLETLFPHAIRPGSMEEIRLIKKRIVEILPETEFILPDYEAPQELDAEDYVQLFMEHQSMSIEKIFTIMKRNKVK